MKKIYLFFLTVLTLLTVTTKAQVSAYSFGEGTETYAAVVGTNITATGDDGSQNALPIGFTFKFGGTDYTTFSANTNGWIRLGANMPTTGTWNNTIFGGAATTHKPLIAAFWDDNHRNTGAIAYSLTGTAPNQILEVGWNNINIGGSGTTSATNTASYKLRIYETTNVIEFVYASTMDPAGTLTSSIGLNDNTSFLSVTPAATSTVSSTTANNSISATTNLVGKKYTFTPNVVSADAMDYVNLQFPGSSTIAFGTNETIYTRGYEAGVTEAAGPGAGVQAWIGYSTTNTNPSTWINWVPATYNAGFDPNNNDEFQASVGSTLAPGTYYYASRWQLNTGAFSYGGFDAGGGNGFWDGTNDISGVLTITPPPAPANDICSGAIIIPAAGPFPYLTGATSNAFATDTNDPIPACQANSHNGLWYSFTPTTTGFYNISSCQSDAPLSTISDNVLSIYTSAAGCTGPFTSVVCNDDGCTTLGLQGVVNNVSLTANTTYYILVYGFGTNTGNVQLYISAPVACAVPSTVATNTITSTSANVTWTGTGTFIVEYGATGFTPGTGATAGAGGTVINPATSPQAISGLTASTAYQVYVRQDCTGAGNGYSANSTVVAFTTLGIPPACTTNTLPVNGATNVDYAAGVSIAWNSAATATEYQVYFSDDNGVTYDLLGSTPNTAILITGLLPLTTYYFYIAPVAGGSPAIGCQTNATSFTTGAAPPPPANDDCANAIVISATPITGTTVSATNSVPAGTCDASVADPNEVWYKFTATANGVAIITVTNISADVVVRAFSGNCGSLTSIGCEDNFSFSPEVLTTPALVLGQTYYVSVSGFEAEEGNFGISVTGAALPISIEYFRGTKQNNRNVLDWKVACYNSPSVTLTLERSADGRSFAGINTTTETAARCLQPFNYNDLAPLAGINYYRLKSVDIDGKVGYSTVVALLNKDKGFEIVSIAPNPVKDVATLSITSAEKSIMEIVVSDLNGKQISKQRISLIAGNNQVSLNLNNVAAGTYQVSGLTADGQVRSLRFVKQ